MRKVIAMLLVAVIAGMMLVSVGCSKPENQVPVLIAKQDIAEKTVVTADMVDEVKIAETMKAPGDITDKSLVIGKTVVAKVIKKGEHFNEIMLSK